MDGDLVVEPELDSFSLFLPLPYRVSLILVLGMLLNLNLTIRAIKIVIILHNPLLTLSRCLGMGPQPPLSLVCWHCMSTCSSATSLLIIQRTCQL